ncbi:hypothetical protein [Streptomyces similanensis]|uniref:Uncharacterized protein n=1 Tax=Streptomyces similanensis TaxID=1274988 RepID=A0ABP9KGY6_9ACTN
MLQTGTHPSPDVPTATVPRLAFGQWGPLNELVNDHHPATLSLPRRRQADVPHFLEGIAGNLERRSAKRSDRRF